MNSAVNLPPARSEEPCRRVANSRRGVFKQRCEQPRRSFSQSLRFRDASKNSKRNRFACPPRKLRELGREGSRTIFISGYPLSDATRRACRNILLGVMTEP